MIGLFCFALTVLGSPFKSKLRLEAENAVLRHQMIVLKRRLHGCVRLTDQDRWFLIQLYRWFASILQVLAIVRPETLVRWHRAGFRGYGECRIAKGAPPWREQIIGERQREKRDQQKTQLRLQRIGRDHCCSARAFAVNPSRLPARPRGFWGLTARRGQAGEPAVPSMQNCAS